MQIIFFFLLLESRQSSIYHVDVRSFVTGVWLSRYYIHLKQNKTTTKNEVRENRKAVATAAKRIKIDDGLYRLDDITSRQCVLFVHKKNEIACLRATDQRVLLMADSIVYHELCQ